MSDTTKVPPVAAALPARSTDPRSVRQAFDKWHKKHRHADRENAFRGWEAAAEYYSGRPAAPQLSTSATTAQSMPKGWVVECKDDSDNKTWLMIRNPNGSSASISCPTETGGRPTTGRSIASQVVHAFAETFAAAPALPAIPEGWKLVPIEPTPEIIAGAAVAAWPTATMADIELARKAAPIVLMQMDMAPGASVESVAGMLATMAPAYRAMISAAPELPAEQPSQPANEIDESLIYPPKAMLKREDWDAATRKPKIEEQPSSAGSARQGGVTCETDFVTTASAIVALDHLGSHNGPGRYEEAQRMLVAAPSQATASADLLEELDWCIENGHCGDRTRALLLNFKSVMGSAHIEEKSAANQAVSATKAECGQRATASAEPVAWLVYALHDGEMVPQYPAKSSKEAAALHAVMFDAKYKAEVRELFTHPATQAAKGGMDETALREAIGEGLRGLYGCGRVWSAWSVGTMSEDDFYPAEESDECIGQVLDAVRGAIESHLKGEGA